MAHLYKCNEWQGGSGKWYVNDTTDLAGKSSHWTAALLAAGLTAEEFVKLLKDKFNAASITYSAFNNVLIFSFATQADARKYKNWINKKSRESQLML